MALGLGLGLPFVHAPLGASASPLSTDLFIIVGQSNAEGRGDSSLSPAVAHGIYVSGGTITDSLADPVGGATTGSMWPAFANEWYTQTGRTAAFVEQATGSTALLPNTSGTNWSPSGNLRAAAVTAANAAIAALGANGAYSLQNVYFVWVQGEQDAAHINGTTITGPLYEQALEDLAAYFKAQVPTMAQMLVVRLGSRELRTGGADWAAIRQAQENACTDSANLRMVYRGAFSFPPDAMNLQSDDLHYDQAGYNLAGKCAAREASKVSETAIPAAPALLGSPQTFMDTVQSTLVSSRTDSHTTASGTKMLVVAASAIRIAATGTLTINSITFNGVAMKKLASSFGYSTTAPTSRTDVAVYYLTEADYGASLSGVTGNIVTTASTTANLLSAAAYDFDAPGVPEVSHYKAYTVNTATSDLTDSVTFADACAVIGVCGSACSSASPLTHTWSALTEDADAGDSNGTRAGQISFAHAAQTVAAGVTVGATTSANISAGVCLVAALRGVIDGE